MSGSEILMHNAMTRRTLLAVTGSVLLGGAAGLRPSSAEAAEAAFEAIHARIGGRLGVHALDLQTGRRVGFDDASRYAMASTFKLLLAAAILAQVDRGKLGLDQKIAFGEADMVPYAPVTSTHLAQGSITVRELGAAIVELSDNPAANLLLQLIGGPPGLTQFMRGLGDSVTRLDRREPDLNTNLPDDPRDTTTPRAMVDAMAKILTGSVLSDPSRALLADWLVSALTGLKRIRAGLPPDWKAGAKSGSGANGAINDVAIAWPPGRKPILIAVYMSGSSLSTDDLSAAHAEIATEIVRVLMA
jgi:beta-lactamase class A